MKKISVILLFVTSMIMSYGQTNVYHKFPSYIAEWKGDFGGYQSPQCYQFTYSISNDIYVDTIVYHAIALNKWLYPHDISGMCNFSSTGSYTNCSPGAIREDTIARKVFFLETDSIHEKILYDFSLNIGDTVKSYVTKFCSPGVIVTQIDSILIDGNYRKRWTYSRPGCLFGNQGQVIEGIGSTMGLLEPMVNFEWWGTLTCFSQDFINLYSLDNTTCPLPLITNASFANPQLKNISISPNPAKNSITISQPEPTFNKYEIYSLNGKLVAENKITSIQQKVDLTEYAEGMYVVKLIGAQKVEFKKIVVVE